MLRPPEVAYLGWVGHENLGDDAIWRAQMANFRQRSIAVVPGGRVMKLLSHIREFDRCDTLLIGGGTLVGREDWLRRLNDVEAAMRPRVRLALGVGVEEEFAGRATYSSSATITRWADQLRRFDLVTVRGPRSMRALKQVGLDAEVTGDPALALGGGRMAGVRRTGRVAMNVTTPEDLYGGSPSVIKEPIARVVKELTSRGLEVVPVALSPDDVGMLRAVTQGVSKRAAQPKLHRNVGRLLETILSCDLVISQRLHGAVLAASVGLPFVALEYRPKCLDFAESVGAAQWCLRVDQLGKNGSRLLEKVEELYSARELESQRLAASVAHLNAQTRKVIGPFAG